MKKLKLHRCAAIYCKKIRAIVQDIFSLTFYRWHFLQNSIILNSLLVKITIVLKIYKNNHYYDMEILYNQYYCNGTITINKTIYVNCYSRFKR